MEHATLKNKALVLMSGGMDSTLAAKLVIQQGVFVEGIHFVTPFCTCDHCNLKTNARELGIKVTTLVAGVDYFQIVANPKYGHGRCLNPCIDCRIYMLTKVREYMEKIGASFIVTGDVLNQRPMSQTIRALATIEKESGLSGLIVRPLSGRLLKVTVPEREGILDRGRFLAMRGRRRLPQMTLAAQFGLPDHLCPSAGCLLVQDSFAPRIRDAIVYQRQNGSLSELYLLRVGRHFRLPCSSKLIVSRNTDEERHLSKYAREGDLLLESIPAENGPLCLLRPANGITCSLNLAACIVAHYYRNKESTTIKVAWRKTSAETGCIEVTPATEKTVKSLIL